jgi:hypothetical protein
MVILMVWAGGGVGATAGETGAGPLYVSATEAVIAAGTPAVGLYVSSNTLFAKECDNPATESAAPGDPDVISVIARSQSVLGAMPRLANTTAIAFCVW